MRIKLNPRVPSLRAMIASTMIALMIVVALLVAMPVVAQTTGELPQPICGPTRCFVMWITIPVYPYIPMPIFICTDDCV